MNAFRFIRAHLLLAALVAALLLPTLAVHFFLKKSTGGGKGYW